MSGLNEINEHSMIAAHKAGVAYWQRNKPHNATKENLELLARSCGWHDEDCTAWLAGFYGAKRRDPVSKEIEAIWELIGAIDWIAESQGYDTAKAIQHASNLATAIAERFPLKD